MKLHFEENLPHQLAAIEAVCDLFRGQEVCRTEFTVTQRAASPQMGLALEQGMEESALGIGNRLTLLDDELRANLTAIQLRNGLAPSESLANGNFTVEMETGTGKTYVYLRTAFELHKRYGFTKFVIVVPSVAIKEGVYKSLQITADHFRGLYANTPFDYFVYDSAKLGQVRNFATSPNIQVMVVTVGAINKFGDEDEAAQEESDEARRREKSKNVMYRASEKTGGEKPIDLIRATRPILIVDEPQSVDGGLEGRGRKALERMHPMCTLRYSATHVDKHHMVYRLDAIDAYEQRLVKQIEVASGTVEGANNKPFVRFLSAKSARGTVTAKVELDVDVGGSVRRKEVTVMDGFDLEQETGRAMYHDCRVGEIRAGRGSQSLELRVPGGEVYLKQGEAWGDVDPLAIQRQMIKRTIREHLDKEKRLRPKGIKVLSLFFIDEVAKYREYDAEGNPQKGVYAQMFEEEYRYWARHPDYQSLFKELDMEHAAEDVHNGYFSVDKKKIGGKSVEVLKDTNGTTKADDDTYNLIMRDKERLLDLATPLKFIFSHSALREGWDNPNVFQICTLRDIRTERERRQSIGRGLRLCVDKEGQRVQGFETNTLTVIANESYEAFADGLQKELEDPTTGIGIRFGVVAAEQFAAIAVTAEDGSVAPLGVEQSRALRAALQEQGYLTSTGKVEDALRTAIKEGAVQLPEAFEPHRDAVVAILRKLAGRLEIKDADKRRDAIPVRRAVLDSPEFKALWDRIKHRTTYRVQFDNDKLIEDCIEAVKESPPIAKARLQWRKAGLAIGQAGVQATEQKGSSIVSLDETDIELPDILTDLQDRTQLTRRSIQRVLAESQRLDDFKRNPQQFIEQTAEAINRCKRLALVDGIKYRRIGDGQYYAQELFQENELRGYIGNMLMNTEKAVYEHVVYDSDVERDFASELERNEAIKVYAKLPGWFKVPTPLGTYNPDWAVLVVGEDGQERLYFVVETKGGLFNDALRPIEEGKIKCGKAHFKSLAVGESPAEYIVERSVEGLLSRL
ncbi:type III restriction-modification system endonuclease [Pseudoxanthomonas mexicana]|uniref:type III restriction-modification system endonuclease n=1 Tax=Pseudoxanthomonas mexicana TaxID=128785 RepID=UPI0022F401EB|nr:DEAD/DEAH box helicase family protein [Pseudoxanthomonas mexicana]WBX95077.1 DEAD/DEAH box helicase family protein [Pseudoxanthomonas mexicana]